MSETQTPRTDALEAAYLRHEVSADDVFHDARELERELAAERATWCDKPEDRLYHAEFWTAQLRLCLSATATISAARLKQ